MGKMLTMLLLGFAAAVFSACGAAEGAGTRSGWAGANQVPVGVWERTLRDDVGPDPVIVMELRGDGTYSVSGVPFVEDKGSYTVQNGVLSFTSNVNPGKSRILAIKMDGENALTLFTGVPFPYSEVWTRKQGVPNFPSVAINGADIPEALPLLMASALAAEAQPWREDALPTWMRVERMKSGEYQIVLHFFSPSTTEELRITVTEHGVSKSVHDGSRAASAPLPPIFMDLPRIVEAAGTHGFTGALKNADIRVYKGHGAAWMARFEGARTGATFSATTGERIEGDVTGYIAQYEADWNRIGGLWHQMLGQYRKEDDDYGPCEPIEVWGPSCLPSSVLKGIIRSKSKTSMECSGHGGTWTNMGCY